MIHHIRQTADGVFNLLLSVTFGVVANLQVFDIYVRIAATIFGAIASISATVYYIKASSNIDNKKDKK